MILSLNFYFGLRRRRFNSIFEENAEKKEIIAGYSVLDVHSVRDLDAA
jgi:hypothetical protein